MKQIGQHAVVVGASMGGLLAARALSDFFNQVTILERDAFPASDIPRKGVPQGRHAHGLLARGRDVIEEFFPGWTDEVVASGGARGDIVGDTIWVGHGVTLKSEPSDMVGLLASRPVLEGRVRRRLLSLPNVRAIENCAAQRLVATNDNSAIQGVRVKVSSGAEQVVLADLVVDASGRGSSGPAWLEGLGYARPEEERIDIGIFYTTRLYRRQPTDLGGKVALVIAGSAPDWRNGALLLQTDDCWIVSIGGYLGDQAPDDEQMFAAYARSLPRPEVYDVVSRAEPLTDFASYRHPRVVGARPAKVKFINWYVGKLHKAARHDGKLANAFLEVANLKARPERLLHPAVVARVIRGNLGRGSEAAGAPAGARA